MKTDKNITSEIVEDSIFENSQITTFQVKLPTIILAELNTHRVFSRNASSLRAIPVKEIIRQVQEEPFIPSVWTSNKPGMQGDIITDEEEIMKMECLWLESRDKALDSAGKMMNSGLHKQVANRVLMPYLYTNDVITTTKMKNFFNLRLSPEAEPHMKQLAERMAKSLLLSKTKTLEIGEWHIPYILDAEEDASLEDKIRVSVARCARVSYKNFDGWISKFDDDLKLYEKLLTNGHASPFEHVAVATFSPIDYIGMNKLGDSQFDPYRNFDSPFAQYRALVGL